LSGNVVAGLSQVLAEPLATMTLKASTPV